MYLKDDKVKKDDNNLCLSRVLVQLEKRPTNAQWQWLDYCIHVIIASLKYRVIFFKYRLVNQARLGVSRMIYVNVDSPNISFPY